MDIFLGMIDQLSLDKRDTVTFVSAVANSLFSDGTSNWGRVASLTAFGAVVCQYFKDKGRDSHVEMVAEELASYLLTKQKDWLINNNYWVGGCVARVQHLTKLYTWPLVFIFHTFTLFFLLFLVFYRMALWASFT